MDSQQAVTAPPAPSVPPTLPGRAAESQPKSPTGLFLVREATEPRVRSPAAWWGAGGSWDPRVPAHSSRLRADDLLRRQGDLPKISQQGRVCPPVSWLRYLPSLLECTPIL